MTRQSALATGPEASDWWRFGSGDEPACELFFAGGRSLAASRKPAAAPRGMAVAEQANRAQASGQDAAPLLASLSLGGCIQMDTLPEVYARSQWKGRSAEEAIAFFGTPQNMERTADGSQVVMQWYTDTSYSRYEVVGSSSEMQGNVMVNTNYWDTVNHPNRCIISVTVDKSKRITQFEADDGELLLSHGCAGMKYGPP